MAAPSVAPTARPWNPDYKHTDRERWICVYPAYINSRKSLKEGRRIPKDQAVDNPSYAEIRDVCAAAGLTLGVENKVYPRELDHRDQKFRGRIRVQLRNEEGQPMSEQFPSRNSLLLYLGQTIPKLKARTQSQSQSGGHQQQSSKQQKKKGRKGK
ncbi:signal recognition particle 19 kDa protein-like [Haliotis cracherodii]|uniref:signal recognition particle 19 kDa protein-like n=1 Tax=Haliotis rufescens TaxID=6454 RepID=UPI001EB0337A|nr:signal recognition particle 19 kDa protein-like [Haliotis rufescens]